MNNWCRKLHEFIEDMKEEEAKGSQLNWDIAQKIMIADHVCRAMEKEDYWKKYNEDYRGAKYPDGGVTKVENHYHNDLHNDKTEDNEVIKEKFNYHPENNEIDVELKRIMDIDHEEMTYKALEILSEHFGDLMLLQPKMYDNLLEKLKEVKY